MQERIRLAREIHDGLAQTLAFLKLQAAQLQGYLSRGEMEKLGQTLDQNYQTLSEAYLETREVVDNLRLGPHLGLLRSIDKCISDFENGSGLKVERKFENLPWEIPVEIQAQIVRIIQEVFSNIRKHARATQVWVGLRAWDEDLLLDIRDNGIGFTNDLPELSQYGLRGMQERADMIGADFQITSRPNQGTVVHLRLPSSILEMFL
jgi:two-component system nitrate/nitrite sensor histidine kinase NarX